MLVKSPSLPHLLLVGASCCASATGYAAPWEWGSKTSLNSVWNDNPALADDTRNPDSTFRLLAAYEGEFLRRNPDHDFSIRPRVTRDYYTDRNLSKLESTDYFLPGSFVYRRPRTTWSFGFSTSNQSILSDESVVSEGGIDRLNADDTVERSSISPSLSWLVTERDSVFAGVTLSDVNYALDFTNRADSTGGGAFFTYDRSVTQRQSLGFSATYSSSDATKTNFVNLDLPTEPPTVIAVEANTDINSTSNTFTINYSYATTETTALVLKVGRQTAQTDTKVTSTSTGQSISTDNLNFKSDTYDVLFRKTTPTAEYVIGANRSVSLATNGQPQDRYQISLTGDKQLTEKLRGKLLLKAWQQESIALLSDDGGFISRFSTKTQYASADLGLGWALTRKWRLQSSYQYNWRQRTANFTGFRDATATSNQIVFGFTYLWKEAQR